MKEQTKNIICLCILIIVPIILLILCSTGYSFRQQEVPEHFFSSITNYFSPKEIPKMDESIHVEPTTASNATTFPLDNEDDEEVLTKNIPNMNNNYSLKDIDKNFKPKSTSVNAPIPDNSILHKNLPPSNMHKIVNQNIYHQRLYCQQATY